MKKDPDTMLQVTSYEVLGTLPDVLTKNNGDRVVTAADWQERRAEIYKTAVELQYGTMPPAPEFLEVETLYVGGRTNSYKIKTGKRSHPISFRMQLFHPNTTERYPVIVDGDMCFPI